MALCLFGTRRSGQEMSICILGSFYRTWDLAGRKCGCLGATPSAYHSSFLGIYYMWATVNHHPALSLPDTLIVTNCFITPSIFLFLSIIAHPHEVTKLTPSCPDSFCNHTVLSPLLPQQSCLPQHIWDFHVPEHGLGVLTKIINIYTNLNNRRRYRSKLIAMLYLK